MAHKLEYNINKETDNIIKLKNKINSLSAQTAGETVLFEFKIMTEGYGLDAYIKKWKRIDGEKWRVVHNYCLEAKTRKYKAQVFDHTFHTTMLQADKKEKLLSHSTTPLYVTFTSDDYVYVHNLNKIDFDKIKAKKEMHNKHSSSDLYGYGKKVEKVIYQLPVKQGIKFKI